MQTVVVDKANKRPNDPELFRAFERLNTEWLEEFFVVEDVDRHLFNNVQDLIVDKGGVLVFVLEEKEAVGCGALLFHSANKVELTKMAVTQSRRGKGYGRHLMKTLIDIAKNKGVASLELITNTRLTPAIELYKSFGFIKTGDGEGGVYERGDYEMLLSLGS